MGAAAVYLSDLSNALQGDFARFAIGLVDGDAGGDAIGCDSLLDDLMLAAILARFEARFGKTDRRAVVSIWASSYFTVALPAVLAGLVLFNRAPRLDLNQVGFVIAPDSRVQTLQIRDEIMEFNPDSKRGRVAHLVQDHLAPFIDHVARRGGITHRVLWSNAGNVFEAFLVLAAVTTCA